MRAGAWIGERSNILCINLAYPGGEQSVRESKSRETAYRCFKPEPQFVKKLEKKVGEGHNIFQLMNVAVWAAQFAKNNLISKIANDCPCVLGVYPLRVVG